MNTKATIIVLEDDPVQSAAIKNSVAHHRPDAAVETVYTESKFYELIVRLVGAGVAAGSLVVVADAMFPWADPSPDMSDPPFDIADFMQAGTRCWQKFREEPAFAKVPWIYYTVLEKEDIDYEHHSDDDTSFIQKSASIRPLLDELDERLGGAGPWDGTDEEISKKLWASEKMKAILKEGLETPLEKCSPFLPEPAKS